MEEPEYCQVQVVRVFQCPLMGRQRVGGPLCILQGSSLVYGVDQASYSGFLLTVMFIVCRRPQESEAAIVFWRRVCLSLVVRWSSPVCEAVW